MRARPAVRKDKASSDGENSTRREESDDKGEEGLRGTTAGNDGGDRDGIVGCQTEQNRDEVLNGYTGAWTTLRTVIQTMQPQG